MEIGWNVIVDKDIIDLFIGDTTVIDDLFDSVNMPRMTGPGIRDFADKLGIKINYDYNSKIPRWEYFKKMLEIIIHEGKINLFFKSIFDLSRFEYLKDNKLFSDKSFLYYQLLNSLMDKINQKLFFKKCHIEYDYRIWKFELLSNDDDIKIECNNINNIDKYYIKRRKAEIDTSINIGDYDSTITKSRTLIDEIIKYGIEYKQQKYNKNSKINDLYNQFREIYNMHNNKEMDKMINNLLVGLEKILTSITEIRNAYSDSHSAGSNRIKINRDYATLIANSSITMSEFLIFVIYNEGLYKK